MLDHEEKFLFKEEIGQLGTAMADTAVLDNVEDLLTDVITSPRFDSEVFTLERSLQVMLGARAGSTFVGLLTVTPEVFDEVAEVRIAPEVHERLVAWRARFGLAIDNALNFLNNPDGIQGHIVRDPDRPYRGPARPPGAPHAGPLQQRAPVLRRRRERVPGPGQRRARAAGPYLEPDAVDPETIARLKEAIALVERKTTPRG